MTIRGHINLLQALHRSVDGVAHAPDIYPNSISVVPAILVVPGPAVHMSETMGRGDLYTQRQYYSHLYYDKLERGVHGENMNKVYDLAEAIINRYHAAGRDGLPGVEEAYPDLMLEQNDNVLEDDGLEPLVFSGTRYTGFTFSAWIRDVRTIT